MVTSARSSRYGFRVARSPFRVTCQGTAGKPVIGPDPADVPSPITVRSPLASRTGRKALIRARMTLRSSVGVRQRQIPLFWEGTLPSYMGDPCVRKTHPQQGPQEASGLPRGGHHHHQDEEANGQCGRGEPNSRATANLTGPVSLRWSTTRPTRDSVYAPFRWESHARPLGLERMHGSTYVGDRPDEAPKGVVAEN
jgi:hypothetical protein